MALKSIFPYGWKINFNYVFPEKRNQMFVPSLKIILTLLTLIIRYILYQIWCYIRCKKPVMDYIKPIDPQQIYGVPLGGIGGGTIGRGFKGEFCRFQMRPGIYEYDIIDADQFIVTIRNSNGNTVYQNVLSPHSPPKKGHLNSWKWNYPTENATYTALYPRSWTEYRISEYGIKLICRQISPVIPHNYTDSCLPGGVFVWTIENSNSELVTVTITFCLKGYKNASTSDPFIYNKDNLEICGMQIYSSVYSTKCIYAFGAKKDESIDVSSITFNPKGSGAVVWDPLMENGCFNKRRSSCSHIQYYGEIACAVAAKTLIPENSSRDLEFAFVWHMPFAQFRNRSKTYERYYTKYYGKDDTASIQMCHYAVSNYKRWEKEIEDWQNPILNDDLLPDWYKSAIFNELYFISDGGSVWLKVDEEELQKYSSTDPRREYGKFAYLEGQEYRMYNSYDVHFYASFTLIDLWPKLQLTIQYEIRDNVNIVDRSIRWFLFDGRFGYRKSDCSIPHDIGDPEEEPFMKINAYPIHDVAKWKDLNIKFVLQCYRDFIYTNDVTYLNDMWPQIKELMNYSLQFDTDDDGMIENTSCDQTYDTWKMSGVSAYCGGLWLAAVYSTIKMATILEDENIKSQFITILEKAKNAYHHKLWNGYYYNFDSGTEEDSKTIMSDQLCGLWYLHTCDINNQILPDENVKKALRSIYENNVKRFKNGECGAVNGMLTNGQIDTITVQSQEVWIGVSYALASHFILQGMIEEGLQIVKGIYDTVYNKIGLAFQTPEALYESNHIRSTGYMRPLSIWATQIAWQKIRTK